MVENATASDDVLRVYEATNTQSAMRNIAEAHIQTSCSVADEHTRSRCLSLFLCVTAKIQHIDRNITNNKMKITTIFCIFFLLLFSLVLSVLFSAYASNLQSLHRHIKSM